MSPSLISSTLALVWVVAPALALAVAVLWVFVLIAVYAWVIKPLVEWLTKPGGGFFKRIALWPVRKAGSAVERLMREQIAAARRYLVANMAPLVLVFDQTATVVNQLAGTLGDMSEQIYEALWTLNNETVPRKITAALVPIRNVLTNHTNRLNAIEDLNRQVAVALGDTLRALPWGAPGGYVTNFQTFLGRFAQLWSHYWNVTRPYLNTLASDVLPEIRRDIADLARRLDVQIDARFDALAARLSAVEGLVEGIINARIPALQDAIDALATAVFEGIEVSFAELVERIGILETLVTETIPERFRELEQDLLALRTEIEAGIATGVNVLRDRIENLERAVFTTIPQQLQALQAAIDSLATAIFEGIEVSFAELVARIEAIELEIGTAIPAAIEAVEAEVQAMRDYIGNVIIPRITALEAILEPAAFAALILATLRVSAPYLFCRNVVTAAKEACAVEDSIMDDLLLGAFALIGGLSIREFARELQAATGFVSGAVNDWVIEN